ncbi:MAG: hypothetical protein K6B52_00660 [Clostridiales bacterium]|nr:hypothetical protein [Clostridiales bacterium]
MKKIICVIIGMLTAVYSLPFAAFSSLDGPGYDYEEYFYDGGGETYYIDKNGKVNYPSPVDGQNVTRSAGSVLSKSAAANCPSYFNLAEQGLSTEHKTQQYNDCWSFATISALESNALVQGAQSAAFSSSHLTYFALNPLTEGYYCYNIGGTPNPGRCWDNGGRQEHAVAALASLEGIAQASAYPDADYYGKTFDESCRFDTGSGYVLDRCVNLTTSEQIKEWICVNGEAVTNLDFNTAAGIENRGRKRDSVYDAMMFYYPVKNNSYRHSAAIIGWDDNVPASAFKGSAGSPENDGAWIVKESSGIDDKAVYVSYDQTLYETYGFTVRNAKDEMTDFTHSSGGYKKTVGSNSSSFIEGGNVFTAGKSLSLSDVSLYFMNPDESSNGALNAEITVSVYKNLPADYTAPDDGDIALSESFTADYFGYYTHGLSKEIPLTEGEIFAVTYSISCDKVGSRLCAETGGVYSVSRSYESESGQSYIRTSPKGEFTDVKDYDDDLGNVFVHVYAVNGPACDHEFRSEKVKPTCVERGYTLHECEKCGYTYKDSFIPVAGHTVTEYIYNNDASAFADGTESGVCTVCGATVTRTKPGTRNPTADAKISPAANVRVEYRTKLTVTAECSCVPESCGCYLALFIDGECVKKSEGNSFSYYCGEVKTGFTYEVKIIDSAGKTRLDKTGNELSSKGSVTVQSTGFFARLAAFFKSLFNSLPEKVI